jgi:hypothetical protein
MANFLAISPSFVEWPAEAVSSSRGEFGLCVYGDFAFGTTLAEMTRGANVGGRKIQVKWIKRDADLRGCSLVFVSRSEQKSYARVFQILQDSAVLTVGETPGFLEAGGMVQLEARDKELQFDVNLAAAGRAHLKISSRLLALARRVVNSRGVAKG